MRVGLCGAQGVGKTTLLNALRSETLFKDFHIGNEVTREIAKIVPINQEGTKLTQELIMAKHAFNILAYDNLLTDRTPLDCVLYTHYLWQVKNAVSSDFSGEQQRVAKKFLILYDYIIYIRPEFDLVADDHRPSDKDFAQYMYNGFETAFFGPTGLMREPEFNNPVIVATGSVRERVQQIVEKISNGY